MNYFSTVQNEINYLLQFYTHAQIDKYAKGLADKVVELYNKCQPKKVPIASLKNSVKSKYYVVTSPDGYVPVLDCIEKVKDSLYKIQFSTGEVITASHDHLYQLINDTWIYARELTVGDKLIHACGETIVTTIEQLTGKTKVYDLSVNHHNHRYYTDGVCSHNSGKSLFLANLGVNWALAGMNVLYLTLELSENLVSMRVDSMVTDIPTRDIFKSLDDVEMKVKMIGKKSGAFQVKYMPSGKTPNDIRSYLKEYEIKTGRQVDVLLIDYLDLLMPNGAKVSAENLFIKDKYVSEELRNLAMELNTVFVTAAQLNRGAVEEIEFDHSHISGGLSKIQTADNVIGIFTSRAMRERGRYQIQLMKTRSSSGVGAKVDLEFDVDSLRIRDLADDEDYQEFSKRKSTVYENLKRTTGTPGDDASTEEVREDPREGDTVGKIRAETDSTKLREFLNNLPGDE